MVKDGAQRAHELAEQVQSEPDDERTEAQRIVDDGQTIDLAESAWIVVHEPDGEFADFRAMAEHAKAKGALLVALSGGYTIESLDAAALEREGWIRVKQATAWREALEYYAAPHRPEDYLNDDGDRAKKALEA